MKNISRREFVKGTGMLFLSLGRLIMLSVFSYVALLFTKAIFNITYEGWRLIGLLMAIFAFFYIIGIFLNKLIQIYKSNYGDKANANIVAFTVAMDALVVSGCSAMAVRAFYQDRIDNIVMWTLLLTVYLFSLFKEARERELNG
jgi:hypothetical protein